MVEEFVRISEQYLSLSSWLLGVFKDCVNGGIDSLNLFLLVLTGLDNNDAVFYLLVLLLYLLARLLSSRSDRLPM